MRRLIAVLLLMLLFFPLSAKLEVWLGADIIYDLNIPTSDVKDNLESTYGRVETINSVGLGFDALYFPFSSLRIGPFLTLDIIFPVGVTFGGATEAFISYESDYRLDTSFGLSYYQLIGPRYGFFLDFGMEYGYYRASTTNDPNSPGPVEYRRFGEWSLIGDLGIIAVRKNSYFRFYAGISYSLFESSLGLRVVIGGGGGFII